MGSGESHKNKQKHDVNFEWAAQIFLDPFSISIFDHEHSFDEDRWITLGKDRNNVLLVVIHTFQETEKEQRFIRIISARKATKQEKKQYEEK